MSYRGFDPIRTSLQVEEIQDVAGHELTWRKWLRSTDGDPDRGIGEQNVYEENTVTGFVSFINEPLEQDPVGQVPRQRARLVTTFQLDHVDYSKDEFIWSGTRYRVETQSYPSRIAGQWVTVLVRGEPL